MGKYQSKHLFHAVENNQVNKVRKIIKSTHTTYEQSFNQDGLTPFQLAAQKGLEEIVQVMLDNGFNPNIPDGQCWFPLHHCCKEGHAGVIKIITSENLGIKKADVNSQCVVNSCKCNKQTALHVASLNNYYNCVVLLLTLGSDLTIKDKNKKTPYDIAVSKHQDDIVEFMKPFLAVGRSGRV